MEKLQLKNYSFTCLLVVIFGLLSASSNATTYYVSYLGNDANSGTSASLPWKTLSKVNSFSYNAGDKILFNRGDIFYGTLSLHYRFGSSSSPILYSAYGTGEKPIITGFTTISGWVSEGNGIYSKVISAQSQTNMVTIDDVQYAMGRFPNTSRLNYESSVSNTSITDNQLGSTTNWSGGEAVIWKNPFTIDRCVITSQSGNTLTFSNLGSTFTCTANQSYFIQNDLRTLDQFGEWYHDLKSGKLYMYFGTRSPNGYNVKVATLNNLAYAASGEDYIIIDNMSFVGSIQDAISFKWQNDYFNITNCDVFFAGLSGINLSGINGSISGCDISNCNRVGIMDYITNATITNNTIRNIGIIEGQGGIGELYRGAIVTWSDNCTISNNYIENCGFNGINAGTPTLSAQIKNNYIKNSCFLASDQGAIYLNHAKSSYLIDGNIIINSNANGIFLDELTTNVKIWNNTVFGCSISGIKLHKANNISIKNNLCFNNTNGIGLENWINERSLYNDSIIGNKFIAKSGQHAALLCNWYNSNNIGVLSNNYYARPTDDNLVFYTNLMAVSADKTLAQWKSITASDANSSKSPQILTSDNDFNFQYNPTKNSITISLSIPMIDITGKKYVGSVTLAPYTSIVLMKDNNPAPADITVPIVTAFSVPSSSSSLTVPVNSYMATDNIAVTGFKLTESSATPKASDTGWSTNASTLYTFASEGTKTLYAWAKDAANNVSKSVSVSVVITLNSSANAIGNTEVFSSVNALANRRAMPITFSETGEIQSISIYHDGGTGNLLLGVYSDQNGLPASQLGVTSATAVNSAAGWQTVSLTSPVTVISGQTVWLSWVFEKGVSVRYTAGTPSRAQSAETWSSGMPSAFGTATILGNKFSIYCTYTPGITITTLGNTEVFSSVSTLANRRAMPVTFSEAGEIQSISIYHDGGIGNLLLGVYSDQTGLPSSQLGVTSATAVNSAAGWQTVSLTSPVSVVSGQKVWLSWVFEKGVSVRYTAGTPSRAQSAETWSSGMPSAFGTATILGNKFSIYCTYTHSVTITTLGNTEVFSSVSTLANRRAMPVTFSESGEIQSLSIYHDGGTGNLLMGVYSDQTGLPASQLGVTSATAVNLAAGWQTVLLTSPVTVISGQTVWLSWVFEKGVSVRYTAGTPSRVQSTDTWSSGMPAAFGTATTLGNKFSIYCSYTNVASVQLKSIDIKLGIDSLSHKNAEMLIYPNPTKGDVNIVFSNTPELNTWITIYDISGRLISKIRATDIKHFINMSDNKAGLYFIKSSKKGSKTYKLIVE